MSQNIEYDDIFLEQYEIPDYFIRKLIESRILGTGTHLQFSIIQNGVTKISYAKIPIQNIEEPLFALIELIFNDLLPIIPKTSDELSIEIFENKFFEIYRKYRIKKRFLIKSLNETKEPIENWNYMDKSLKIIMILSAFFNSIDTSLIYDFEKPIKRFRNLHNMLQRNNPNAPKIEYYLENFGFVFRARGYIDLVSQILKTNEYDEIISNLDNYLINLYIEYFIDEKKPYSIRSIENYQLKFMENEIKETKNYNNKNLFNFDFNEIKNKLNSGIKENILDSFKIIEENHLTEFCNDLELFFDNDDEEILEKSLKLYINLKNQ